jgi:hypothetical protein
VSGRPPDVRWEVLVVHNRVTGIAARAGGGALNEGAASLMTKGLTRTKDEGTSVPPSGVAAPAARRVHHVCRFHVTPPQSGRGCTTC